jgi:hypothetical protein
VVIGPLIVAPSDRSRTNIGAIVGGAVGGWCFSFRVPCYRILIIPSRALSRGRRFNYLHYPCHFMLA